MDSLLPSEMALQAELIGVSKANMSVSKTLVLAILAVAFIAFGSIFFTTVTIGNIIGGAVLVGLVYWFVFLRKSEKRVTDN